MGRRAEALEQVYVSHLTSRQGHVVKATDTLDNWVSQQHFASAFDETGGRAQRYEIKRYLQLLFETCAQLVKPRSSNTITGQIEVPGLLWRGGSATKKEEPCCTVGLGQRNGSVELFFAIGHCTGQPDMA